MASDGFRRATFVFRRGRLRDKCGQNGSHGCWVSVPHKCRNARMFERVDMKLAITNVLAVATVCVIFLAVSPASAAPPAGRGPGAGIGQAVPRGMPVGVPQLGRTVPNPGPQVVPVQQPLPPQIPQLSPRAPQQVPTPLPSPTPRRRKPIQTQVVPRGRVPETRESVSPNAQAQFQSKKLESQKVKQSIEKTKSAQTKDKERKSTKTKSSRSQAIAPKTAPGGPAVIPSASPLITPPPVQAPAAPPPVVISQAPRADPRTLEPVWAELSPEERARLHSAHQNAMSDPGLAAFRDRYQQARKEYRDRLRDALLKADPSVQPILEKVKKSPRDNR
jgi:hypothetical protein